MTTNTTITDGRFAIFPEGSGWMIATIRDGRIVDLDEQSQGGPEPSGSLVLGEAAEAIIRIWDADADPMSVVVERL
jgi:hypothetical protein